MLEQLGTPVAAAAVSIPLVAVVLYTQPAVAGHKLLAAGAAGAAAAAADLKVW